MLFIDCQRREISKETPKKRFEKITSIKHYDFFCRNEIDVCRIITKQEGFQYFFSPVVGYKKVKLSENGAMLYENQVQETIQLDKIYLNMDYYIPSSHLKKTFTEYYGFSSGLRDFMTKKQYLLNLVQSFQFGLKTMYKLNQTKLVHMQLFPKNILFMDDDKMILTNFSRSFHLENIKQERNIINQLFSTHDVKNIYLPLEAHLLSFMKTKNLGSLSLSNIEEVAYSWKNAIKQSSIGGYLTEEYFGEEPFFLSLLSLTNKRQREIEDKILDYSKGWNAYAYGILFLQLCRFFETLVPNAHRFSKSFVFELQNLIHVNPNERKELDLVSKDTMNSIFKIEESEWMEICSM
jgi:hypothetical protein